MFSVIKRLRWLWFDRSRASGGAGGVPVIDPMKDRHGLAWRRVYWAGFSFMEPRSRWTPLIVVRVCSTSSAELDAALDAIADDLGPPPPAPHPPADLRVRFAHIMEDAVERVDPLYLLTDDARHKEALAWLQGITP